MTAPAPYPLTPRQLDVARYIAGYVESFGIAPTRLEIGEALGLESKSSIQGLIDALEERGHLRRLRSRERAIELLQVPAIPRSPTGAPLYFTPVRSRNHG